MTTREWGLHKLCDEHGRHLPEIIEEAKSLYQGGYTMGEIAQRYGVTYTAIFYLLKNNGAPTYTKKERARLTVARAAADPVFAETLRVKAEVKRAEAVGRMTADVEHHKQVKAAEEAAIPRSGVKIKCTKCGKTKDEEEFHVYRANLNGRNTMCKLCRNANCKKRYDTDPEHRQKQIDRAVAWVENNREAFNARNAVYVRERCKTDICFRLSRNLRKRHYDALKGVAKATSAVRDLGCTPEELRIYLETKFLPGMTWDNYGQWHVDHIRPLVSYDLSVPEQQREACHYRNLQPLWKEDNLAKAADYAP